MNSGSCQFQISHFNIANYAGVHTQEHEMNPLLVCWSLQRLDLDTISQRPLRLPH